jgi:hypothetical protein
MASTLLELLGFASLTDAAYTFGGRGWAFLVAGLALLFVGTMTNDDAVRAWYRRQSARMRGTWRRATKRKPPVKPPSPHPSIDELLDPSQEDFYRALAESAQRRADVTGNRNAG